MKYPLLAAALVSLSLNSCNTCIGMGRDIEQCYTWTKDKIQGGGGGAKGNSGTSTNSGAAPVY